MQSSLDTAKQARARKRVHDHYLKGSLFCGACSSRLRRELPTNKQGIQSAYYSYRGRRTRKTKCTRRAIPVTVAEQLVANCYAHISINKAWYVGLAKKVEAAYDGRFASRSDEPAEPATNQRRLEDASDKIFAAHLADGIDINEDEEATLRHAEPYVVTTGQNTHVRGSTTSEMVV